MCWKLLVEWWRWFSIWSLIYRCFTILMIYAMGYLLINKTFAFVFYLIYSSVSFLYCILSVCLTLFFVWISAFLPKQYILYIWATFISECIFFIFPLLDCWPIPIFFWIFLVYNLGAILYCYFAPSLLILYSLDLQ